VLDLGGASTQISFVTQNYTAVQHGTATTAGAAPPEAPLFGTAAAATSDYVSLVLLGRTYTVYAVSFLGFGAEVTRRRFNASLPVDGAGDAVDPCVNTGYSERMLYATLTGSGDFAVCVLCAAWCCVG